MSPIKLSYFYGTEEVSFSFQKWEPGKRERERRLKKALADASSGGTVTPTPAGPIDPTAPCTSIPEGTEFGRIYDVKF